MKKILYYLPSIIFNVIETLVIFIIGVSLKIEFKMILLIFVLFAIVRIRLGGALHYKSPFKCAIWSLLIFFSLFLVSKVGFETTLPIVIFCAYILTSKGNIQDIFMWKRNELNARVYDWVKFNSDNEELLKYKQQLKQNDKKKYYIYVYYFEEHKSQNVIAKIMGIDVQRVGEEISTMSHHIEYGIRLR